ncbi:ubiquitin-associated domain-containing protein 1-like [Littorina saxatilis]|uniref:UBA domain-containing protein n=1 Tax=Littorina saxatilis TaxID=31220 RepID=A0AAN9G4S1_9CAEN
MVVTDAHLFPPFDMKVRITSWDGRDTVVDLQREWTVDRVKIVAMEHFLRPGDSMKTSLYHKLLHVRLCKGLSEELTLGQEGVKENDELLLLKRRLPPSAFELSERQKEDRRTPDVATIRKVTSNMPKMTYNPGDVEPVNSVDFQTELRRILVSLIEASQRILCLNPSAAKIFKQAEEMLSEPLPQPKIDAGALKQLTDMGFPESRAKKALLLNKMAVMAAMDWLFQNENDPDIDTPLPELDEAASAATQEPTAMSGAEGSTSPTEGESTSGGLPHYTNILDTIRAFKKREFRANPRALQRLIEMGFGETESVEALRMFRNDQDAACDWLLGDRRERAAVVEEGLDPSSLVYQAIMENPTVQLGLNNPRCLLAFLQMLENPIAANQWLNDPETGPILMQVSRIYQMRLDGERAPLSSSSSTATTPATTTANTTTTASLSNGAASTPTASSSVPPASTNLHSTGSTTPGTQASSNTTSNAATTKRTPASGSR